MTKIVSVANRKGGVGKSLIAHNLAEELADAGYCVLIVDFDSQCNITGTLFEDFETFEDNIYTLLEKKSTLADAILKLRDNLYIIPGSPSLHFWDNTDKDSEYILSLLLSSKELEVVDYIIIDNPPDIDIRTLNSSTASDYIIAVTKAEMFSVQGLKNLMEYIKIIKENYNSSLDLIGIVMNAVHIRRGIGKDYKQLIRDTYEDLVFTTTVSESVDIEKSLRNKSSIKHAVKNSKVAQQITYFTDEFLKRVSGGIENGNEGIETIKIRNKRRNTVRNKKRK